MPRPLNLRRLTINAALAAILAGVVPAPAQAQQVSVSGGYSSMPGRLGARESDHGGLLRVGLGLRAGKRLSWSIEGGAERHNEVRRTFTSDCVLPNDVVSTCHFDSSERDAGWSLSTLVRYSPTDGTTRPYALVGVGFLSIRTHGVMTAVDNNGASLPNFNYDGVTTDGAAQLHLGAGIATRPSGSPVGFFLEGRATRLFYNYSGGLQWGWNPSVTVGIRR